MTSQIAIVLKENNMTRTCSLCGGTLFAIVTYDAPGGGKLTEYVCDTCGAGSKVNTNR